MIVNKIYATKEEDVSNISKHDLEIIEEMSNRNDCDSMIESLFERSYYGDSQSYDFNRTGGGSATGLWGLVQSIPSFLISSIICWPATVLAGIGILSNRFQERWQDKKSWLNRLDPRFWADYMGKPHELAGLTKGGGSLLDRALLWPITVPARIAGVGAAALGLGSLKDKIKNKVKGAEEKIFGFKEYKESEKDENGNVIAGAAAGAAVAELGKDLTPEEIKNLVFRPYWITLSNGEILRVRADSEEHAKLFATFICSNKKIKLIYAAKNERIKKGCGKYKFLFDDGEIAYGAGDDKDDAMREVLRDRQALCEEFNKVNPNLMELTPLEIPMIINGDDVVPVYGEEIPLPEEKKFKKVTTEKPNVSNNKKSDKLPNPVYEYMSLHHFRVVWANFAFNMPVPKEGTATDVLKKIIADGNSGLGEIERNMGKHMDLYVVKFHDGDRYIIAANDRYAAEKLGYKLYKSKHENVTNTLTGKYAIDLKNFQSAYGKKLLDVKSCEPYQPEDPSKKPKDFSLKRDDIAKVGRIYDNKETNEKIKYNKIKI